MNSPKINIRHKCLACGSELSEPLFTLPNMPAGAQSMPTKEELGEDYGIELPLCRCDNCGLVQFDCEPVDYYRDAIRVVGLSETMKELRRADYRKLIDNYGMGGKKWIECGCGNGDFLKVLSEFDVDIYGIEHGDCEYLDAVQKLCVEGNVPKTHIMQFFTDDASADIPGAPFDVFTSFNFLEHQPDPRSMLLCIHHNLADGGYGIITVPSFEYIIGEGRYYELVRDHIANYDISSLKQLCVSCGFEILEEGFIGIGDTIRLIVRKSQKAEDDKAENAAKAAEVISVSNSSSPVCRENDNTDRIEKIIDSYELPDRDDLSDRDERSYGDKLPDINVSALAADYERMSTELAGYMGDLARKGRSAALWGAGHQGFTIAATTVLGTQVKYIIDSSPKKQGRYAPASHLRIVSPDEYLKDPVDVIIIAAPGYVKEIERSIRERYKDTKVGVPAICSILDLTER